MMCSVDLYVASNTYDGVRLPVSTLSHLTDHGTYV